MPADLETRIKRALKLLEKRRVLVGITDQATVFAPPGKAGIPLWIVAYMNEFGDDEKNIPPRPFLVPGVASIKDKITKRLSAAAAAALTGNVAEMDRQLSSIALEAQGAVQGRLTNGPFTPLSPKTIYNRQHRKGLPNTPGPNSRTSPLIDTRHLFLQIQGVVAGR